MSNILACILIIPTLNASAKKLTYYAVKYHENSLHISLNFTLIMFF